MSTENEKLHILNLECIRKDLLSFLFSFKSFVFSHYLVLNIVNIVELLATYTCKSNILNRYFIFERNFHIFH